VREATERVADKRILDESVGLLFGTKLLQELYVEWHFLSNVFPSSSSKTAFEKCLGLQYKTISDTLKRVRAGGGLIRIEELALSPQLQDKVAEIAKMNHAQGISIR
jgi:hypothetical protein